MSAMRRRVASAAATMAVAALSACGGSGAGAAREATTSSPVAIPKVPVRFDPAQFAPHVGISNQWLPLKPGTQWVRDGATNIGNRRVPHRVVSTVTDVSRRIDGVRSVAVLDQDIDAGQLVQQSLDWFATDKQGNVWALGGYTAEYEAGRFTLFRDAWLAGADGGTPGVQMLARPELSAPAYSIAKPPGADPDVAKVIETNSRTCVTLRCFAGVLVIREGKASAPDNEFKYYAAGVGQILNTPKKDSKHKDFEQLINVRRLSPRGLAELSKVALGLDRQAAAQAPKVFGPGAGAARGI